MAMKTIKTTEREVSVSGVKFVAFSDVAGVYPDVLVWEKTDSDPEELGFDSCVWFPAQFEAPDSLMSNNDYLVEYHEGLDWEEAEAEIRKDLDALNEYTHEEMYGHSYVA